MCSYREKKSEPQELMQLEGYTVDYTAPHTGTLHDFEVRYWSTIYLCKIAISICSFWSNSKNSQGSLAAKKSQGSLAIIPLWHSGVENHAFRKKLVVRLMKNKLYTKVSWNIVRPHIVQGKICGF